MLKTLFLIPLVMLSFGSISVAADDHAEALQAEPQVCHALDTLNKWTKNDEHITVTGKSEYNYKPDKIRLWIRKDCEAGDVMYFRVEWNRMPAMLRVCRHETITRWKDDSDNMSSSNRFSCIYRGADNILKIRGMDE